MNQATQPSRNLAHENRLLAMLSTQLLARLQPRLESITLTKGQTLYDEGDPVDFVVFPTSGLISLTSSTAEGGTVEILSVSSDGLLGLPLRTHPDGAPHSARVLVAGAAFRLRSLVFLAECQHLELQELLLQWAHRLLCETSQAIVCHRFHRTLERLCRWLLTATDRLHTDHLGLTQDELGEALGVPRTSITSAAVALQDAGVIRCRHGRITILNRRRLELSACECYRAPGVSAAQRSPETAH